MEAELVQLAREAVVALQAANSTSWAEQAGVVIAGLQLVISGGGLIAILVGLKRMGEAGARRDREIDELGQGLRQQGQALEQQGAAMTQALTQQGAAMTQALTQQGQALERQGEMMTQALQGLRQQGEVLAELLRRGQ